MAAANERTLRTTFEKAQAAAEAAVSVGEADRLQLYGYYKQATVGPCNVARPSTIPDRVKFDAWGALGDMDKNTAEARYLELVDRLSPGWRPAPAPAAEEAGGEDLFHTCSIVSQSGAGSLSPVQKLFAAAQSALRALPVGQLRDEDRLQLDANFNQATRGSAPLTRPPASRVDLCVKYAAWVALGTRSREEAMEGYCRVVNSLLPAWRLDAEAEAEKDVVGADLWLAPGEGLRVRVTRDARGLVVQSVQDGVVSRWNDTHPDQAIKQGAVVLTVNGQKVEPGEKPLSYAVDGHLRLTVRRAPATAPPSLTRAPSAKEFALEKRSSSKIALERRNSSKHLQPRSRWRACLFGPPAPVAVPSQLSRKLSKFTSFDTVSSFKAVDSPGWYVLCANATVRAGASMDSEHLQELPEGTALNILEIARDKQTERVRGRLSSPQGWISISDLSGRQRWADRSGDLRYLPGRYQLRVDGVLGKRPDLASVDVATLQEGAIVNVLEILRNERDDRIRGRVEQPTGWLSLATLDQSERWVLHDDVVE